MKESEGKPKGKSNPTLDTGAMTVAHAPEIEVQVSTQSNPHRKPESDRPLHSRAKAWAG